MTRRILIIGAQQGSLGAAVRAQAAIVGPHRVVTAGISRQEDLRLDVENLGTLPEAIETASQMLLGLPDAIICTAGVNFPGDDPWLMEKSFSVNVIGHMNVLSMYETFARKNNLRSRLSEGARHFVSISSNSAHIPRSGSTAYCASKAALSMAVRVRARELARKEVSMIAYTYEPGWIDGTPMSERLAEELGDTAPHRIPAGHGIDRDALARMIIRNLASGRSLNGCSLRVDGGEI